MEKNLRQDSSVKSTLTQSLASYCNTSFAKEFTRDFTWVYDIFIKNINEIYFYIP